jgi:parvulin-like peptidyl-prolyl isomerase
MGMHAPIIGRIVALLPLAFVGCSFFDRDTDRFVEQELREGRHQMRRPASDPLGAHGPIVRQQAPEGPLPPTFLPEASPPSTAPAAGSITPVSVDARPNSIANPSGPVETRVKVVATVGPEGLITDEDVLIMMRQRAREYLTLPGADRVAKEKQVYKEELRRLIERELVINDFIGRIRKNKPQLVPELWEEAGRIADGQLRAIRSNLGLTDESAFVQMLESQGVTLKAFRRQMERAALSNMYIGQFMRERNRVISLKEVQEYYLQNEKEFQVEDRVKWQHFFVSNSRFNSPGDARKFADWALQSLKAGADFGQMAKEHGHGDSSLRGGDGIGTKRGEIQPVELEKTVFSLGAGKTSDLIITGTGIHIVRVVERDVAGVKPLTQELQGEIRQKLSELAYKRDRDRLVEELWRKTTVTIVP